MLYKFLARGRVFEINPKNENDTVSIHWRNFEQHFLENWKRYVIFFNWYSIKILVGKGRICKKLGNNFPVFTLFAKHNSIFGCILIFVKYFYEYNFWRNTDGIFYTNIFHTIFLYWITILISKTQGVNLFFDPKSKSDFFICKIIIAYH